LEEGPRLPCFRQKGGSRTYPIHEEGRKDLIL
jgi:hypothetical protein